MNGEDALEIGGSGIAVGDIRNILLRRRWWVIVPFVLGLIGATIAAFVLPKVYQSTSTLLIESQQIPTSLVASPFSNLVDERIGKIRQHIMSRANLSKLMDDNRLYVEEQAKMPLDAVLAKMRTAIAVDLVSASAGNAQNRGGNTTIAFSISYRYGDPERAHAVVTQLTEMFINEDRRLRTEQAVGALTFLKTRADEIQDRLIKVETERRTVQARYAGALPDQALMSANNSAMLRGEVARIDGEIQSIMQQNNLLAARTEDTIATAEPPGRAEVRRLRQVLSGLSATLSDQHPDVIAAREALEAAKTALREETAPRLAMSAITSEIAAGRARIAMLGQRRTQLLGGISNADRLLSQSPQAAYELNNLKREQESLTDQYNEIREKQLEAQVAGSLQSEDKAERFSVVDPPIVPSEPVSPKAVQLILAGAFGGLAAGLVLTLGWELLSGRIHGADALTRLTGEQPLTIIPVFAAGPPPRLLTGFDRMLPWRRRRVLA